MTTTELEKPITLMDPDLIRCPYQAYEHLREKAPVYYDPEGGFFIITRYEDIRAILRDHAGFNSEHATSKLRGAVDPARTARIAKLFEEKGWPRERPVGNYEGDEHKERRDLFERFLRAGKVKDYDAKIKQICYSLVADFAQDGKCELVSQYSEQVSIRLICWLLGAPDDAFPVVKESMDAMVANLGFIGPEEEEVQGVLKEIAAQHYFKRMIDQLRANPDDSILSTFVNAKLPSGAEMTDPQILMHVMLDLFMAGAETTAKALTSGVAMLCARPDVYAKLEADLEGNLRTFAEEVLRLEGPASSLFRVAQKDTVLHGVAIPKGSVVVLRAAAANLDKRQFPAPDQLDLDRENSATHLSFGSGLHSCVGSSLARRELYWGFKALLEGVTDLKLAEGEKAEYMPNMLFRGMERLNVTFKPRAKA